MSEQNILNPSASSQMNPTYSIPHKDPQIMASWQPRSGKPFSRYMLARGMVFQLHWEKVQYSTYEALLQWFHQYEQDFFSYFNFQRNRYFTGQFLSEPQFEEVGNNQFNISATFVELPSLPMFQYPSAWGVSSVFMEERNGFGADLVKLTAGTSPWDHRDKNYALWSEQIDNVIWTKDGGSTVTANNVTDPNGTLTGDTFTKGAGTFVSFAQLSQQIQANFPGASAAAGSWTVSVALKVASGTQPATLVISDVNLLSKSSNVTVTTAWQRFTFTANGFNNTGLIGFGLSTTAVAGTQIQVWGWQFEFSASGTTYTQTTNVPVALITPAANANYHNGFAYFNAGTGSFVTDFAEWLYVGYGFRVWAPKGPDMGFLPIALDGIVQNTIDLYSAAITPSAVVFTAQNVPLGQHRVKIGALNQKNAASSGFIICADAIEVMR